MNIRKKYIAPSKYPKKATHSMTPEFYIVHNTANDAPAENEGKYMESNNNFTSFHVAIDDKEVLELIPENRSSWSAGDGSNGKGNRKGISIEICYSKSGGPRFIQAEKNAAKYIASRLKARNWGIDRVKKHQDFSGKYCPHRTLDMGWNRFLKMVEVELKGTVVSSPNKGSESLTFYNRNKNNKGIGVKKLQQDLVNLGYKLAVDGSFGPAMEREVKKFQTNNNLVADGSAGPSTLSKIKILMEKLNTKNEKNTLHKVQVGAYLDKVNAEKKLKELKSKGIDGFIKSE